jgi:membrane protease YdiL (CAAX protease family)
MLTKPIILYCALAIGISWGLFFTLLPMGVFSSPKSFGLGAFLFMWGPAIAGLVCARIFDKGHMVRTLGLKPEMNRWMLIAWAAAIIICGLSVAVSILGPDVHFVPIKDGIEKQMAALGQNPGTLPNYIGLIAIVGAVTAGAAINGILLISEELGWRGYLWEKTQHFGFWKASLFIGVVWGIWHAPIIAMGHNYGRDYPGFPLSGIFAMILFTTLMSPIISYLRLKNGSVWAATLFHGTINAVAGLTILSLNAPGLLWNGIVGLGGMVALAAGCLAVFAVQKNTSNPK